MSFTTSSTTERILTVVRGVTNERDPASSPASLKLPFCCVLVAAFVVEAEAFGVVVVVVFDDEAAADVVVVVVVDVVAVAVVVVVDDDGWAAFVLPLLEKILGPRTPKL